MMVVAVLVVATTRMITSIYWVFAKFSQFFDEESQFPTDNFEEINT